MAPSSIDDNLSPHVLNPLSIHRPASAQAVIRMKSTLIILGCLSAGLFLTGCNDGGGCDLPAGLRDWLIEVNLGNRPGNVTEYPIFIDFNVQVQSLETGQPPPDGLMVNLSISPGSFVDGQTEIELPLFDGRLSSTLQIDAAGTYKLTAAIDGEPVNSFFFLTMSF